MPDPATYRPAPGSIPVEPGVYRFSDQHGRVIYVGKAKSLRQRLSNYFQNPRNMHVRTAQMVASAETVEWIQVANDVEAFMLEYSLIKQHRPRFNVRLVERIDAHNRAGDGGRKFPAEKFLSEIFDVFKLDADDRMTVCFEHAESFFDARCG